MIRTYTGPLIDTWVEPGVTRPEGMRAMYALAVDAGSGELVLLYLWSGTVMNVSGHNGSRHTKFRMWTVTS